MLKYLIVVVACFYSCIVSAQTDTVFWFAAPEILNNNSAHTDRPILLRVTAFSQPATVTISQPANAGFTKIIFTVAANSSYSYDLTSLIDLVESRPANQVLSTGLLITSTSRITVYYEETSAFNPEMFVLKGKNALGTNFFIPAQNLMNNWDFYTLPSILPYSSFDIIATEDNTIVTITPANNIVGHSAGSTFAVTLNKGEVYSAAATGRNAADHLMGSVVSSNKKIAITIKDDSIGGAGYSGCLDLAGDQIVPLELVGTKYITLPGFLNDPVGKPTDHTFIMATDNNTTININGVAVATINKGQTYHDSAMNVVKYIETSKPAYVLHLSGFGCEVGHAMLPQIECTGSSKVAFTRSNSTNLFMNILVPAGYESMFTFNGNTTVITAPAFDTVPFTNGLWKYARIKVDTAQLPVGAAALVANAGIDFHLSIIHGDGTGGARYGYFSDFNKLQVSISTNAVNSAICAKADLKFFTNYNNALGIHFNWTGPNGFSDTTANPVINQVTTAGSGVYRLTASKFSCANVIIDSVITVNPTPQPALQTNAPVCSGNGLNINAVYAGGSFSWTGPNGFSSASGANTINNATVLANGNYIVTTTALGCISTDTIKNIVVNPTPDASITIVNNNACLLQSTQLNNNNTVSGTNYQWVKPNAGIVNTQNIFIDTVRYSDTGRYILTASTAFCSISDTAYIMVKPLPVIGFAALGEVCSNVPPFTILAGETSGLNGAGVFTGLGIQSNGLFNPAVVGSGTTVIRYTYTGVNGCTAYKEQTIQVNETPLIILDDEKVIKPGESVMLNAFITGVYNSLVWTNPGNTLSDIHITNPVATPLKQTGYTITVGTVKNCFAEDSITVTIADKIIIPNAFSPNGDNKNDKWIVEDKTLQSTIKAYIYDRYGKLIYTSFGSKISWDGRYMGNGQLVPVATYYYVLFITAKGYTENIGGWIQLMR